jgi:hypothetical protein
LDLLHSAGAADQQHVGRVADRDRGLSRTTFPSSAMSTPRSRDEELQSHFPPTLIASTQVTS